MNERCEFEMTKEDIEDLVSASQPLPYMTDGSGRELFGTPQENANRFWVRLGTRMGFRPMTVRPGTAGMGPRFFTAEPL